MANVEELYQEYESGTMDPAKLDIYKRAVASGQVGLPTGIASLMKSDMPQDEEIETPPRGNVATPAQIEKYKTGVYDEERRGIFESAVKSGQLILPDEEAGIIEQEEPEKEPGFFGKAVGAIKEQFTGEEKATEETETLADWGHMPEMNNLSWAGIKNMFGTMLSDPEEAARQIQENSPGVVMTRDSKGNIILESPMAKEQGWKHTKFIIKPGFQESDIKKMLGGSLFALASKGKTLKAKAGIAGGIQAGVEGVQAATGGEFDPEQIPIAAATEAIPGAAGGLMSRIKGAFTPGKSAAQSAVKAAKDVGIDLMTSDVIPPKTFIGKAGQAAGERIPIVGTGPVRAKQQQTRVGAIRQVLSDYGADDTAQVSDDVMKAVLTKHGKDVEKYSTMKKEVIERLSETNVDKAKRAVKEGDVFEDVAGAKPLQKGVVQEGVFTVPTENVNQAIKEGIEELSKRRTTESKKAIEILKEYGDAFQDTNLSNFEEIRKELGTKLAAQDMATVRSTAEKQLSKIYKAVNDDMGDFIKKTGEPKDYVKWKVANKRLSMDIKEMNNTALKQVLKKGDSKPEVVRNMLFSKSPSEIKLIYKGLDQKGKATARTAIWQEALSKAVEKPGDLSTISPQKFKTALNKLQKSTNIFFKGEDKKALDGLVNTLKLTERASTASVAPPTGVQAVPLIAAFGLGSVLGGGKGVAAAVGIGAASRIYESKPVRNALLALANPKPGTEQHLIRNLTTAMQIARQQKFSKKEKK